MKITKKKLKDFLESTDLTNLNKIGAYLYNNKINLFAYKNGEWIDEVIIERSYQDIVNFKEILNDEYTYENTKERVDAIYDLINEMLK